MNPKEFVFWLNGFIQGFDNSTITEEQWKIVLLNLSRVKLEENKKPYNIITD